MDLNKLVADIAGARAGLAKAKDTQRALYAEFEQRQDVAFAKHCVDSWTAELVDADKALREAVAKAYAVDGNKHPHPAVGVRIITRLAYDAGAALEWCKSHLPDALRLDTKRFEDYARKVARPEIVAASEEAQVTIATDLAKWLEAQ